MTTTEIAGTGGLDGGVPVLEARGLVKHFPVRRARFGVGGSAVHAVEDVTLALPESGITAVVGESGSGKSTLARMLAQLIKPTSGSVLLDGKPAVPGRRYARAVQLVLQDPFESLNPVHSVRYHLARPLQVHGLTGGASLDGAPPAHPQHAQPRRPPRPQDRPQDPRPPSFHHCEPRRHPGRLPRLVVGRRRHDSHLILTTCSHPAACDSEPD